MTETADALPVVTGQFAPQGRLSIPEYIDWHMILDQELSQLSHIETGIIGSIGFVGLGSALSSLPAFVDVMAKIGSAPPIPPTLGEMAQLCVFISSLVIAVVCLVIFGMDRWRNRGLVSKIRQRPKLRVQSESAAISGTTWPTV